MMFKIIGRKKIKGKTQKMEFWTSNIEIAERILKNFDYKKITIKELRECKK